MPQQNVVESFIAVQMAGRSRLVSGEDEVRGK